MLKYIYNNYKAEEELHVSLSRNYRILIQQLYKPCHIYLQEQLGAILLT
jgi:hypothetical protein